MKRKNKGMDLHVTGNLGASIGSMLSFGGVIKVNEIKLWGGA